MGEIPQETIDHARATNISYKMQGLLDNMRMSKPNDRSERDRCWAIAITDMQKLTAFFQVYVAGEKHAD